MNQTLFAFVRLLTSKILIVAVIANILEFGATFEMNYAPTSEFGATLQMSISIRWEIIKNLEKFGLWSNITNGESAANPRARTRVGATTCSYSDKWHQPSD